MKTEHGEIIICNDPQEVAQTVAELFIQLSQLAIRERGRFSVAFSGGSTPKSLYEFLAKPVIRKQIDWKNVGLFWSDELFVPYSDVQSNFGTAEKLLLSHLTNQPSIFPVQTSNCTLEQSTRNYTLLLQKFTQSETPHLDLVFLGIGPDGHTASLFPNTPQLHTSTTALVEAVHDAPKFPSQRITFTFTLINNAKNIIFLVTGAEKAHILKQILNGPINPVTFPAQGVHPKNGRLLWLLDTEAGSELKFEKP